MEVTIRLEMPHELGRPVHKDSLSLQPLLINCSLQKSCKGVKRLLLQHMSRVQGHMQMLPLGSGAISFSM